MEQIDQLIKRDEEIHTACKNCKEFCNDFEECVKFQAGLVKCGTNEDGEQEWIGTQEVWNEAKRLEAMEIN